MTTPVVAGIGTAVPRRVSQETLCEQYLQFLPPQKARLTKAVFQSSMIDYRHVAVDDFVAFYSEPRSTATRNNVWLDASMVLGREAVEKALERAGLQATDIDDFIVVSCTGLDTPGLDLRLAGALGMRPNLRRTVIGSMGCYGAFPGLNRALTSVLARPGSRAIVLCVEICSVHNQTDDSRETIVSGALFADGAAAFVLSSNMEDTPAMPHLPRVVDTETVCDYQTFDDMSFRVTDEGFRMYMSSYVPNILGANIVSLLEPLLTRNGLTPNSIAHWGIHPGGARILQHLQESLDLDDDAMAASYAVLRDYGNMSSPTILFVLDHIQRQRTPVKGDYGMIMAFGPGLTMEAALLQW
jgi:predicted naringenin-chalcone synthase